MKRKNPESDVQRAIIKYLKALGLWPVSVPNGAFLSGDKSRRARQMASLKLDGLTVGFPDLMVLHKDSRICFFEVKSEKGRMSEYQFNCAQSLNERGHHVATVRSVDDVERFLKEWGWI